MSYAILLYFDSVSEKLIQGLMDTLAAQPDLGEPLPQGFRPHLTLAGFEPALPAGLVPELRSIAQETYRIPVHLVAVGAFPGDQGVVYLAPAPNPELLELHAKISHLLRRLDVSMNNNFNPGTWMPHCSVAYNLDQEQTSQAVIACLSSPVFNPCELVGIGITEFMPIKEICIYPFN